MGFQWVLASPRWELIFASSPRGHELVATLVSNLGPETTDNEASIEANILPVVKWRAV